MSTPISYINGAKMAAKWRNTPGVFYPKPIPGVGECKYTVTRPSKDKYATIKELSKRAGKSERYLDGVITREKIDYILHEIPGKVPMTRYYLSEVVMQAVDKDSQVRDVGEFDTSEWVGTTDALAMLGYKNKASLNKLSNNGVLHPERARTENGRVINMYRVSEIKSCARS